MRRVRLRSSFRGHHWPPGQCRRAFLPSQSSATAERTATWSAAPPEPETPPRSDRADAPAVTRSATELRCPEQARRMTPTPGGSNVAAECASDRSSARRGLAGISDDVDGERRIRRARARGRDRAGERRGARRELRDGRSASRRGIADRIAVSRRRPGPWLSPIAISDAARPVDRRPRSATRPGPWIGDRGQRRGTRPADSDRGPTRSNRAASPRTVIAVSPTRSRPADRDSEPRTSTEPHGRGPEDVRPRRASLASRRGDVPRLSVPTKRLASPPIDGPDPVPGIGVVESLGRSPKQEIMVSRTGAPFVEVRGFR